MKPDDQIVENVQSYFVSQIGDLTNSQMEYVLDELIRYFDGLLERTREALMHDGER